MTYVRFEERRFTGWKVDPDTGCWLWAGHIGANGYGRVGWQGRVDYAHRAVYEQRVGPIPPGHVVAHRCQNRHCVNPSHLELLTPAGVASSRPERRAQPLTSAEAARLSRFGQKLSDFRRALDLSIPQAAVLLDVSANEWHRWEDGRWSSPLVMEAVEARLANILKHRGRLTV